MNRIILISALLICTVSLAAGQMKEGDNLMGGTIGLWPSNSSATLGFNYENQVVTAGITTLGVGGLLRYSSVSKMSRRVTLMCLSVVRVILILIR
ncbi:MAG: hypothetical protein R3A12_03500 [Ignavibacteria bacterium]